MCNDVDRFDSFPALNRSRHLSRCRFIIGEQDRFDIGAEALEQGFEVIYAAVDEGDLALGGAVMEEISTGNEGAAADASVSEMLVIDAIT